jgi:hypothetical protein
MAKFARSGRKSFRSLYRAIVDLCEEPLDEGVAATNADRYVKRYPSRDFALAMVFHFILGLRSLRELAIHLAEDSRLTRLITMRGISKSHLPKLLHARPADLWAPLIADLLKRLRPSDAPPRAWAIDATTLTLGAKLLARMTGRDLQRENAGAKLSAVINLTDKRLAQFHISMGSGHDAQYVDELLPVDWVIAGITFIFDRGYRRYSFYRDLIRRKAHFVTRECANDHFEPQWTIALDAEHPEIVSDAIGLLGGTALEDDERMLVRRVAKHCDDGKELVFYTTRLDLSAAEVAALYQQRWVIEIFFRWLKSHVNLKRPLGYGLAPTMHTILAALTVYCLALLLAVWTPSPTTKKLTPRIATAIQTMRARLYEKPTTGELQRLNLL